jgi:hypothetical protein
MNEKKYHYRVIACLDILGFKALLEKSKAYGELPNPVVDRIYRGLAILRSYADIVKVNCADIPESAQPKTHFFLDSLFITLDPENNGQIHYLFQNLFHLLSDLLEENFLCRGVITTGLAFHDDDILFGPGMLAAYERERSDVKDPKIIVDPIILELAARYPYNGKDKMEEEQYLRNFLAQDDDGILYLDYIAAENLHGYLEWMQDLHDTSIYPLRHERVSG